MGVASLTTFVKQNNLYHHINIYDEIRKYQATNGTALIIFDVMGFVHNFGRSTTELSLGGRQHIYLRDFEQFLIKLRKSGATLAFFCDGQLQSDRNDVWCRRRDAEFKDSFKMIDEHSDLDVEFKRRFGCKVIAKSLLKLVEEKHYGKVVISTQVDCDSAIAKHAVSNRALAVVASDSDFLIFEGEYQWWEANSINLYRMTAKCFEKTQLRQMLSLTNDQMKYLATIAGNDYIKTKRCDFIKVANFCRSIDSTQCEQLVYREIEKYMLNQLTMRIDIDSIATSIKSYDIHFEIEKPISAMNDYCSANVMLFAFWNQKVFQYEVNFLDFKQRNKENKNNNAQLFLDTLLEVFRKLGGILLNQTSSHRNPILKIVTKYSLHDNYMLKEHTPIYPENKVEIEDLIFGEDTYTKWNLLLWSIGMGAQLLFNLKRIPKSYVHTVLALIFLRKANEITTLQADALLMCRYDIFETRIDLKRINIDDAVANKDVIRVGHLFNRTITLLWDCFMVCGLNGFIQLDWFDGPYFNHLFNQCQHSEAFHTECVGKIQKYRLYATLNEDLQN